MPGNLSCTEMLHHAEKNYTLSTLLDDVILKREYVIITCESI